MKKLKLNFRFFLGELYPALPINIPKKGRKKVKSI